MQTAASSGVAASDAKNEWMSVSLLSPFEVSIHFIVVLQLSFSFSI